MDICRIGEGRSSSRPSRPWRGPSRRRSWTRRPGIVRLRSRSSSPSLSPCRSSVSRSCRGGIISGWPRPSSSRSSTRFCSGCPRSGTGGPASSDHPYYRALRTLGVLGSGRGLGYIAGNAFVINARAVAPAFAWFAAVNLLVALGWIEDGPPARGLGLLIAAAVRLALVYGLSVWRMTPGVGHLRERTAPSAALVRGPPRDRLDRCRPADRARRAGGRPALLDPGPARTAGVQGAGRGACEPAGADPGVRSPPARAVRDARPSIAGESRRLARQVAGASSGISTRRSARA